MDEASTVAVRLGRHKVVAWAYPRSDGTTWDVQGAVEIIVEHDEANPLRAGRFHGEGTRPLLLAAGLSPTCEDSSVDSEQGVDWFRAIWAGSTSDRTALATMLFAFLAVETDWRPDGRLDWDSYRPLNFTYPESRMSVFCYPTLGNLTAVELVLRAVGTPSHTADDVLAVDRSGPPIAGRSARWASWRIREGVEDGLCASILEEGDPDDPDFATRDGVVAWVDGTTTAYVACRPVDELTAEHHLRAEIVSAAGHPFFAPRSSSARPLPEEILSLRDDVLKLIRQWDRAACTSGSSRSLTVYATPGWVQVEVPGEAAILVTISEDGMLEAHIVPEMGMGDEGAAGVFLCGLSLAQLVNLVTTSFSEPAPS